MHNLQGHLLFWISRKKPNCLFQVCACVLLIPIFSLINFLVSYLVHLPVGKWQYIYIYVQ